MLEEIRAEVESPKSGRLQVAFLLDSTAHSRTIHPMGCVSACPGGGRLGLLAAVFVVAWSLLSPPPAPATVCLDNTDCGGAYFCEKAPLECGGAGTCQPMPTSCILLYDPVCGCDGVTYENDCKAAEAGVSVDYHAACYFSPPPPTGVSAGDGAYSDRIALAWNGVEGATEYWIYRDPNAAGSYFKIGTTGPYDRAYEDPRSCGQTFYYKVAAVRNGYGTLSLPDQGSTAPCPPATLTVCADGCDYADIQDAIIAASEGDTVLVRDGVYVGVVDFWGKAITVRSEHGPSTTVIDGGGLLGAETVSFDSGEGGDSVLQGFTVRNGYGAFGGGIAVLHSSPTIRNCIVAGNRAQQEGGGIYCVQSSPTIVNTVVSGNLAPYGGGISLSDHSSPRILNCTIAANRAASWGGGLSVWGNNSPTLVNTVVRGNIAETAFDEIYLNASDTISIAYSDVGMDDPLAVWAGTGNINADPGFVCAQSPVLAPSALGNYHLRSDSPCVGAGSGDGVAYPGLPSDDLDGDARSAPDGYDMGADEYSGTASEDVVLDFGPGRGLWVNYNADPSGWSLLHTSSAELLAAADLDDAFGQEIIVDFGDGAGLWADYNDDPGDWRMIHPLSPELIAAADLDGAGGKEPVMDFGAGIGLWANLGGDPALWTRIHPSSPERMAVGDVDGSGRDDIVLDFGVGAGIWVNYNGDPGKWGFVHGNVSEDLVTGDFDGSGLDDVVIDFGPGTGVWVNYDGDPARWAEVHPESPERMAAGDFDGDGRDDLVMDFGPGRGIWVRRSGSPEEWGLLHALVSESLATGDVDGDGRDDIVIDFGPGTGLWVSFGGDALTWARIHPDSPGAMATGNIDGN